MGALIPLVLTGFKSLHQDSFGSTEKGNMALGVATAFPKLGISPGSELSAQLLREPSGGGFIVLFTKKTCSPSISLGY